VQYAATWKHPAGSLSRYANLQAIFSLGAGVDHLLSDPLLPDVPLLRVVDEDLTARMSEFIVMQCLMYLRGAWNFAEQQKQKVWKDLRDQPAAGDVRVGVMGLGVLGRDAAAKLAAIGFDVAGWSRTPQLVKDVVTFSGQEELEAFLSRTDVLVVLLPLTPSTRGLLNMRLFQKLAHSGRIGGPILINAGRGGLQIETDIVDALDNGTLAAVSLDVFEVEPLPTTSKLWLHPRVHITPHNAAMSDPDAIAAAIAVQIRRGEQGHHFSNTVDPSRGY
jgi:glyoxylate/hydroxypyruvate reductase A